MPAISTQVKKKETPEERAKRRLPFKPPANRSPFLELPAELRAMILGHALTRDRPITLTPPRVDGQKLLRLPRALRVSTQFHQEAGTIFYGKNNFRFKLTEEGLSPIMVKIISFREYLEHVEIVEPNEGEFTMEKFSSIFWDLRRCTHLKTLTIPHNYACFFFAYHELRTAKAWAKEGIRDICHWFCNTSGMQRIEGRKVAHTDVLVKNSDICLKCELANGCQYTRSRRCGRKCTSMEQHCKDLALKFNALKFPRRKTK